MKIFIIILHFGEPKVTYKCLESILKYEKEFENIVVIDNSTARHPEFISGSIDSDLYQNDKRKRKIKIISNNKNLGYAGGMNIGIKYALSKGADYVLVLNNDVIFEEPILVPLIKFTASKKELGIVGPGIKFVRDGRTVFDLGGKVDLVFGRTSHKEVVSKKIPKPFGLAQGKQVRDDNCAVDYVSGCCMMIKKEVFKKIGFYDESFFLYYEDVDFCLRAKKAGFNTYCLSNIHIFHALSKSVGKDSSKAIYYQIKSALIFGKKHIKYQFFNNVFISYQSLVFFIKYPQKMINLVLQLINKRI